MKGTDGCERTWATPESPPPVAAPGRLQPLQPYTTLLAGPNPHARVVRRLTIAFLRFAARVHASRLRFASPEASGTSAVSKMFPAPNSVGPAITNAAAQSSSSASCLQQLPSG